MSAPMLYGCKGYMLRLKKFILSNQALKSIVFTRLSFNQINIAKYCSNIHENSTESEQPKTSHDDGDFFGFDLINETEKVTLNKQPTLVLDNEELGEKYSFKQKNDIKRQNERESVIHVPFGYIRFDQPKQREPRTKEKISRRNSNLRVIDSEMSVEEKHHGYTRAHDRQHQNFGPYQGRRVELHRKNTISGKVSNFKPNGNDLQSDDTDFFGIESVNETEREELFKKSNETLLQTTVHVDKSHRYDDNLPVYNAKINVDRGKQIELLKKNAKSDKVPNIKINENELQSSDTDFFGIESVFETGREEFLNDNTVKKLSDFADKPVVTESATESSIVPDKSLNTDGPHNCFKTDVTNTVSVKQSDSDSLNFIEQQYFDTELVDLPKDSSNRVIVSSGEHEQSYEPLNYVDEQYFTNVTQYLNNYSPTKYAESSETSGPLDFVPNIKPEPSEEEQCQSEGSLGFIDQQYFEMQNQNTKISSAHYDNVKDVSVIPELVNEQNVLKMQKEGHHPNDSYKLHSKDKNPATEKLNKSLKREHSNKSYVTSEMAIRTSRLDLQANRNLQNKNPKKFDKIEQDSTDEISVNNHDVGKFNANATTNRNKELPKPNLKNPKTAYDVAMKIRTEGFQSGTETEKPKMIDGKLVDSRGFRILKDQVKDISKLTMSEVTDILYDNILYNEDDIVAINKPYGLPSQGGAGVHLSVANLLEPLAKKIDRDLDQLHIIHRLDKETTGVMLFAKTAEMAHLLRGAFRRREVRKTYWVITKGIPSPPEGKIVIPLKEGSFKGRMRMFLAPVDTEDVKLVMKKKSSVETREAITYYKVLTSNNHASLVECQPETGVRHQIRVHLAWGLNTPVLGDHKYSNMKELLPQKLPIEMLHKLGIRQAKTRFVPMHLHAKTIVIPQLLDGRNFYVSCRLPYHFMENMKKLKLKPKRPA